MTPAELIAKNLAALPHPDGTPRQLAGFNTQLLPDALQEQVGKTAQDIGEAIVNLLEINGYTVTDQPQAPEPLTPRAERTAKVCCNLCGEALLRLAIVNPERVSIPVPETIQFFASLKPECFSHA